MGNSNDCFGASIDGNAKNTNEYSLSGKDEMNENITKEIVRVFNNKQHYEKTIGRTVYEFRREIGRFRINSLHPSWPCSKTLTRRTLAETLTAVAEIAPLRTWEVVNNS